MHKKSCKMSGKKCTTFFRSSKIWVGGGAYREILSERGQGEKQKYERLQCWCASSQDFDKLYSTISSLVLDETERDSIGTKVYFSDDSGQ